MTSSQLNWIVQMFYYSKSVFSNQYSTFYYSRSIYLAIFESSLNYCSLVWAQNSSVFFFVVVVFNNFFFLLNFFFTTTRIIWLKVTIKKNNYMNQLLRLPLLKYTHIHTDTDTQKHILKKKLKKTKKKSSTILPSQEKKRTPATPQTEVPTTTIKE